MNELQVFQFDSREVRTIDIDGKPWFIAVDVCSSLAMSVTQIRRLDDDEKGLCPIQTLGGGQNLSIVNESGLYSLIMSSRKPEAKRFKKWVTSEVLPAIREKGSYVVQTPEMQIAHALVLATQMIEQKDALISIMAPKAEFFDTVAGSHTAITMSIVAKTLNMGVGRNRIFEILRGKGILDKNNIPYQRYCGEKGYFRVIESPYNKPDGTVSISFTTLVYQKGLDFIRKQLKSEV